MPDPGVFCLTADEGRILAYSGRVRYASDDGGLTWQPLTAAGSWLPKRCRAPWNPPSEPLVATDPRNPDLRYRAVAGQRIEFSEDGGMTWREAYRIHATGELEAAKLNRQGTLAKRQSLPLDGLVDPSTGNAVFAMGLLGALVRTRDGERHMVPVGNFRQGGESSAEGLLRLLIGEALLALGLALLALVTLGRGYAGRSIWNVLCTLGWRLWVACVVVFPPALAEGYDAVFSYLAMLATPVASMARMVVGLASFGGRGVGRVLAAAAAGLLFLLPYVLWGLGALPHYRLASVFAVLLAGAGLAAARWRLEPKQ